MNQYPNNNQFNQNNQYYSNAGMTPQQYQQFMQSQMRENMLKRRERNELIRDGAVIGGTILAYLVIEVIVVSMINILGLKSVYDNSPTFQNFFNVIAVHFFSMTIPFSIMAIILKKRFTGPLVPTKKIGAASMCAWVAFGMGGCMAANIITNFIINLFDTAGYKLTQPELTKPDSIIALISVVISTSVIPGIIEEYAMRCCTLGALKKYGKGFAVFAVSIVFGLIHANLIQFIFAFLVGLVLGYITVVTDNVIPAMLIHAFNNGISVVEDFITYFSGSSAASKAEPYIIGAWFVVSIIGLVYLIVKRKLLPKKNNKATTPPSRLSFGAKLACLVPGFLIPFMILIVITSQYIQHK